MEPKIATVSQINGYVKKILDHNIILNNVWIKGEISNFKHHYSGHLYITLKDEGGVLKAVMFRGSAQSLNFEPSDGMKVLARGRISVYEAGGSYQLYIEEMIPDGVGELYIAYEQLKKQLEEEGLFRPEHKKPIPKFPKRVGVVTASTGAAVRDIINVITRRYPIPHNDRQCILQFGLIDAELHVGSLSFSVAISISNNEAGRYAILQTARPNHLAAPTARPPPCGGRAALSPSSIGS